MVDAMNSGLRVRSRYSRRATIPAFGQERVAAGHQADPLPGDGAGGRPASGRQRRVVVGRAPDVLDEQRLEARLDDLEPADRRRRGRGPRRGSRPDPRSAAARARRRSRPAAPRRRPGSDASQTGVASPPIAIRSVRRPLARLRSRTRPPATSRPWSTIATDSHIASAASIWWVEKMSVRPRSRSSVNASRRRMRLTGSRPVNGSSISRTSGSCRTAAMNWTFCWLPLDSSSARRVGVLGDAEAGQPAERVAPGLVRRHRRTASRSRRAGRGRSSAGRGRAPRAGSPTSGAAARRPAGRPSGSRRRRRTTIPRQIRIVVVLPAPFAPRKPKTSPRPTSKVSPSRAIVRPEPLGDVVDLEAHRRRIARFQAIQVRPVTVRTTSARSAGGERDDRHDRPSPDASSGVARNASARIGTCGMSAWIGDDRQRRPPAGTSSAAAGGSASRRLRLAFARTAWAQTRTV